MNENELKALLREVEPADGPAADSALVEEVRGKLARRRQRHVALRVGGAIAVVMILGGSALLLWPGKKEKPVARTGEPPPAATRVAATTAVRTVSIDEEIVHQEKLVATLLEREAGLAVQRRLETKLAGRGPISSERAAEETAAKVVVELADVIRANEQRQAKARETYAGVVRNFPETQAARTAKERLLTMGGL